MLILIKNTNFLDIPLLVWIEIINVLSNELFKLMGALFYDECISTYYLEISYKSVYYNY